MKRRTVIVVIVLAICSYITFWLCKFYFRYYRVQKTPISPDILDRKNVLDEISEIIIPRTDTPGAKEADVSMYIISVFKSCLTSRDKRTLLYGFNNLDEYCQTQYSSLFANCSKDRKIAALAHFQDQGAYKNAFVNKVRNKLLGKRFFELIKDLTVAGYCSSKVGATQGLAYDHIPGNYIACVPLSPNQRAWATD
ncbi:gluconate 2-dehydrogenase subunit 3 family protein [Albibacterium profundi]|uniref:Gluconate 2-dehydrogenase subunit 3 family protein n=1 Tax=Albibacterium profundi TaxID=3134906 RepID=A0ABV5CAY4_9SPHI